MLLAGRGRFLYSNQVAIRPLARELGVSKKIRMAYIHESKPRFMIVSKKVPPEVFHLLNQAMKKLEQSGVLKSIADKYLD